jgi:hypothetical protein
MTQAYLYKYTQQSTNKWYVGSRTAKNCHPEDGYTTSSKIVKPQITAHPEDWHKQILCVGERAYIQQLESDYLKALNAATDPTSYNLQNQDGYVISQYQKARKGVAKTPEHCANISKSLRGRHVSTETRKKIGDANRGQTRSNAMKGKKHKPEVAERFKQNLLDYRANVGCPRTGTTHNLESKEKMRQAKLTASKKHCVHCNKSFHAGPYGHWHGDKCKLRGEAV